MGRRPAVFLPRGKSEPRTVADSTQQTIANIEKEIDLHERAIRELRKYRKRVEKLDRVRKVWHAVLEASGDLESIQREAIEEPIWGGGSLIIEPPRRLRPSQKLSKSTKLPNQAFATAAKKIHLSLDTVKRIFYAERKRRISNNGWTPDENSNLEGDK